MTEQELRLQVAEKAKSYIGLNEADGSYQQIIDCYNSIRPLPVNYKMSYTDPWCAAFVSAVGAACNLTDSILPECSCDRMIALYKAKDRWEEDDSYAAQLADIVMYDWDDSGTGDCTGSADHVGIIVAVNTASYVVCEGNISDRVGTRTLSKNGRYIRGFCCPDYASAADGAAATAATAETSTGASASAATEQSGSADTFSPRKIRYLRLGDTGEDVGALQKLLIAHGYDAGSDGADGVFGQNTQAALVRFQNGKGLLADGEFGPDTFAALWGYRA